MFRPLRVLVVMLVGLTVAIAWAQPDPAVSADEAFRPLQREFTSIYRSLSNTGRLLPEDRPAVVALLERAEAFGEQWPDHLAGIALRFQLARWLDDEERVGELYPRLVALKPDDAKLALSWLTFQDEAGDLDEEALTSAYREVFGRFPKDPEVCIRWAKRLKSLARYDEAIDALEAAAFAADETPEAVYELADCYFARHRFEEANTTLTSIPPLALQGQLALQRDVNRIRPIFGNYAELWSQERELRAAETEADDLPLAEIITSKGRILVELFENQAPNTVANFISLAESGFYVGTRFHRYEPDFMIQGGDPFTKPDGEGSPGYGNPGYCIPDEHTREDSRNHFGDSLAMAKRAEPNSAGCQFYFTHRPTYWLNGKHTVFGRVLEGLETAHALRADDEITSVVVLRKRDHPYEPETVPVPTVDIKRLNDPG
jgi:cyclophilin family peptidyl-prolyl cis-trans isomerase